MFTYKLRAYPSKPQEQSLFAMLDDLRRVYNWAVNERRQHYRECQERLSWAEQSRRLTQKRAGDPNLQRWNIACHQETIQQVRLAFEAFHRRVKAGSVPGHPRFKGPGQFKSATFVMAKHAATYYGGHGARHNRHKRKTNHQVQTATVRIMGIGHLKVHEHRPIEGAIKTITVKRERHKWFVTIVTDHVPAPLSRTGIESGIDVGKETFIATSEGELVTNPRFLKRELATLARQQRSLAAAPGGTKAKRRAGERMDETARKRSKRVGDTHERIANKRRDLHNKLVHQLVTSADVLYVEDLDIAGMIEGDPQFNQFSKTAENRNTYDAGWGLFIIKLVAKAESAGRRVVLVDPSYTSQRCHECGHIARANRAKDRFCCLACGHVDHADVNAAKNIKARGQGVVFRSWRPQDASDVNSRSAHPARRG